METVKMKIKVAAEVKNSEFGHTSALENSEASLIVTEDDSENFDKQLHIDVNGSNLCWTPLAVGCWFVNDRVI
jgi:hypothetical protein